MRSSCPPRRSAQWPQPAPDPDRLAGRAQGAGQQSIVIKPSDRSIQYLNGAQWADPAGAEPKIGVGLMPSLARARL